MTLQPTPARLSPTKRVIFSIVMLACVAGLIEVSAIVGYRGLTGRWHHPGEAASWRAGLAAAAEDGQEPAPALPQYMGGDVIHPYVGFVIDPGQAPASRFGFPSDPFAESDGALRIAVFGGSVAGMTASAIASVLPGVLERQGVDAGEVDVLNLGLGGGKQPQQMLALAYLQSLGARFDIVVNIDGFNEVVLPAAENAAAGVYPFYPRGWKERVGPLADSPTLAYYGRRSMYAAVRRRLAQSLDESVLRRSAAVTLLGLLTDRVVARRQAAEAERLRDRSGGLTYSRSGPSFDSARAELLRESAEVWLRSSVEMDALARSAGSQYFHFLQPNQYLRDSKPLTAQERRDAYRPDGAYGLAAQEGYPLLVAAGPRLRAAGVAFTDLTRIFADDARTLYIDDCCHLNPEGTLRLAQVIAEQVAEGVSRPRLEAGRPAVPSHP